MSEELPLKELNLSREADHSGEGEHSKQVTESPPRDLENSKENLRKLTVDVVLPPSIIRFFNLRPAKESIELEYINVFLIRFLNVWGLTLGVKDISDVNKILVVSRFEIHNKNTFDERLNLWERQNMFQYIPQPPRQPSMEEMNAIWGSLDEDSQDEEEDLREEEMPSFIVVPENRRSRKSSWLRKLCCID